MYLCFTLANSIEELETSNKVEIASFVTNFNKAKAKLILQRSVFSYTSNNGVFYVGVKIINYKESIKLRNSSTGFGDYTWLVQSIKDTGNITTGQCDSYYTLQDEFYDKVTKYMLNMKKEKRVSLCTSVDFLEIHPKDCVSFEEVAITLYNLRYKLNIDTMYKLNGIPVFCRANSTVESLTKELKSDGVSSK